VLSTLEITREDSCLYRRVPTVPMTTGFKKKKKEKEKEGGGGGGEEEEEEKQGHVVQHCTSR